MKSPHSGLSSVVVVVPLTSVVVVTTAIVVVVAASRVVVVSGATVVVVAPARVVVVAPSTVVVVAGASVVVVAGSSVVVVAPGMVVVVVASSVVVVVVGTQPSPSLAPLTQTPATHWSPTVHELPSLHALWSGSEAEQAAACSLQVSVQSESSSGPSHGSPGCTLQLPPAQLSLPLQNTPSSHGAVLSRWSHSLVMSLHASVVQPFSSAQLRSVPVQTPPLHASFSVQNRPSSHSPVVGA